METVESASVWGEATLMPLANTQQSGDAAPVSGKISQDDHGKERDDCIVENTVQVKYRPAPRSVNERAARHARVVKAKAASATGESVGSDTPVHRSTVPNRYLAFREGLVPRDKRRREALAR